MSPWAKLDDGMGEHRKTRKLLKQNAGMGALGLHTLAILHCSKYLTDGVIDQDFLDDVEFLGRLKPKAMGEFVAALVASGQWDAAGDHWVIHDYLKHNPSRAAVEKRRADDATRKARGRGSDSRQTDDDVPSDSARTPHGHASESGGRPLVPSLPGPAVPVPPATEDKSGLTAEGGGSAFALGDPGPEEGSNVSWLRDPKTGDQRGVA